ncbi:hypothetical protein B0I27_101331 [Arcticibacter pallidicorallinus]|uniref:Uncharacterized protein n=1 Tax=Arcticibacter pallidicorallinus TaxID=1259464 RepID=A0A2T0UBU0_9SPHI|nr:hypothetical protein [Arcticibacter pallidicorallinus]PRY55362.1 hypothetical protein B0I27_101331 [Arcticibacter pallidicorallinus]
MRKLLFSAAILSFAGITAISASNHEVQTVRAGFAQDTTDTATSTPATPADTTTTAGSDTTSAK